MLSQRVAPHIVRPEPAHPCVVARPRACMRLTTPRSLIRARSSEEQVAATNPAEPAAPPQSTTTTIADPVLRRQYVMEETRSFLEQDLHKLMETGEVTRSRYSPRLLFEDPITRLEGLEVYVLNIKLLRSLFNVGLQLHSVRVVGEDEVLARWTVSMELWLLPWRPNLMLTGTTTYKVAPDSGLVLAHIDTWDAIQRQGFLSLEGLQHVLRMFMQVQLTPSLETPKYSVLRQCKSYEVRRYSPFLVAEKSMGPGAGPASGSGFQALSGYLSGSNRQAVKLEVTTPVVSSMGPAAGQAGSCMQFVMEQRFHDVAQLPEPLDPSVNLRAVEGGYVAALRFSGWPLDHEVVQAERQLRELLLKDGCRPAPGYRLARYNSQGSVPPFLRRNEVLIALEAFQWPPQ